ncbi:MAG TPA: DUF6495 family protein [Flavobacterium sp.]|nr:DUF6495 family protein [Flavobacterium sp.]
MKYSRLTKEQFEELHPEFTNFLAAQSIDKDEWDQLKKEQPHIAEQELDVFSDLIWEGVLNRAEYLEHFGKNYVFFFHCGETHIHSIILKTVGIEVDFLTREGLQFLTDNLFSDQIEMKVGTKAYDNDDRNQAIFQLIQQGAFLSDGSRYRDLKEMIA